VAQQVLGSGSVEGDSPVTVVAGAAVDSRVEQVARQHGARVVRCGVGIQAVVEQMELVEAEIGGEWSGGVALSHVQRAFDGLAVMARLLESVARERGSQRLADELPVAHTRTTAVPCPVSRAYSAVARLREQATGKVIDRDGLRVELEEGWYYVRVSHTEPVIRIICEARQPRAADELIEDLTQRIRLVIGEGS
jgi:phosphoglucosamine mutase